MHSAVGPSFFCEKTERIQKLKERLLIKKSAIMTGPEPGSQPMFRESTSSSSGSPPWLRYVEADEVEGLQTAAEERRAGAPSQVTEEQERAERLLELRKHLSDLMILFKQAASWLQPFDHL